MPNIKSVKKDVLRSRENREKHIRPYGRKIVKTAESDERRRQKKEEKNVRRGAERRAFHGEKRPEQTPCRAAEHPEGERADKYVKLTGTDEHFI